MAVRCRIVTESCQLLPEDSEVIIDSLHSLTLTLPPITATNASKDYRECQLITIRSINQQVTHTIMTTAPDSLSNGSDHVRWGVSGKKRFYGCKNTWLYC